MDLSIIIVNWNSLEYTKGCLASIRETVRDLEYEIIVVDNHSQDDCEVLAAPAVKVIRSDRNLGFAGANNLGTEYACGDVFLFLNPDTLVLGDAIRRMLLELDSAPDVGAVGCRLLNGDLTLQMSCVQPFPSILNQLFAIDWLKRRWPTLPLWGMQALFAENQDGLVEVEVVSGACLMVKRNLFEKHGGFSTEYFMYAEEVDLCHRIRQAGAKVCYIGQARIIHFGGQSTKKKGNSFSDVVMRDSVFKVLRKFRGRTYAALFRAVLFLSAVIRMTLLSPLLLVPDACIDRESSLRAFQKWRKIAAWRLALRGRQGFGKTLVSSTAVKN